LHFEDIGVMLGLLRLNLHGSKILYAVTKFTVRIDGLF